MRILYKKGGNHKRALVHKTGKTNVARKKKIHNKCGVNSVNENLLYAGVIVKWKPLGICFVNEQILPMYIKASLFPKIWYRNITFIVRILLGIMTVNIL